MSSAQQRLLHPRDVIVQTMERIYRHRMTTTSGGNLSIADDDGGVWITPTRVDKGSLRRDDVVCVRPDGSVEGPHPPSSEYPFHQAIYQARPDIRGIVHAHSVALVAFSISGRSPDTRVLHQARRVCGEVGFAPYALPGSQALAQRIVEAFRRGYHCVVLENHGVVVGGDSLQDAFERFETLEFTAKTIIKAGLLGQVRYLTDEQLALPLRASVPPPPSFTPRAASSREKELRRQLCDFLGRGYQKRLLISTQGSFSTRVEDSTFLITPNHVDRYATGLDDLVLVCNGAAEAGKSPSRAARLHQAIYERHAEIGAIVNAYTVNATAFSVSGAALASRTIPESYLLLRDVARVPFGVQFSASDELAQRVSGQQPIAVLENDGVLVCGTSVLDAFDRLEVLDATAEAIINSRPLGEVVPMSEAIIAELIAAFQPG